MLHIAIVSSDPRVEELLKPSGLTTQRFPRESWSARSIDGAPSALLLDVRGLPQLPAALTLFRRDYAGTPIVLITSSLDGQMMLEAMRAGVSECVVDPLTSQALDAALRRVIKDTDVSASQVFAFIGAKGGVGTTTIAVNVATSLGSVIKPERALMIELQNAAGDATLFTGAETRFSIADALENTHRLDQVYFRSLVTQIAPSTDLLASPDRAAASGLDVPRIKQVIAFASTVYKHTVIDVARSDRSILETLDQLNSIFIVVNQELATVKSASRMAGALRKRYGNHKVSVVLSRSDRQADIGHADVERAIGSEIAHTFPSDYRVALQALNKGRPLSLDNHNELSGSFKRFASSLAGVRPDRTASRGGLLGRLTARRA